MRTLLLALDAATAFGVIPNSVTELTSTAARSSGSEYSINSISLGGDVAFWGDDAGGLHRLIRTTPW